MLTDDLAQWLLDSDPSLRHKVERDLLGAPAEVWQATRARTATEGFGRAILEKQDPDGQWAGGAYFPAGTDWQQEPGQPWTATTHALNMLRGWGVSADHLGDTAARLARNSRWEYEDLPYWGGEVDVCINAWTLLNGIWLGVDVAPLAQWFVEHRQPDGGYNCEWESGSTRSSIHSTINALGAMLEYEKTHDASTDFVAARHGAEEYLLERRLMFRKGTTEPIDASVSTFMATPRHLYSTLRAVDYFRQASEHDGVPADARLADAVALIRSKQQEDGRWPNDRNLDGRVWFDTDDPVGEPSRLVTFQALRALNWYDGAQHV